jgi:hypothetical protein
MKPWFENLGHWALSHPLEVGELALITGLITLYGFFRNDVWAFLSFCGARFKRATKRLPTLFVHLHLQQPGKPLEVRFAVTDQFAKQHLLPAIPLHTIDMAPKK